MHTVIIFWAPDTSEIYLLEDVSDADLQSLKKMVDAEDSGEISDFISIYGDNLVAGGNELIQLMEIKNPYILAVH